MQQYLLSALILLLVSLSACAKKPQEQKPAVTETVEKTAADSDVAQKLNERVLEFLGEEVELTQDQKDQLQELSALYAQKADGQSNERQREARQVFQQRVLDEVLTKEQRAIIEMRRKRNRNN